VTLVIADGHDPVVVEIFVDPYFVTTFPAQTDNQYMTTLTGHHPRKITCCTSSLLPLGLTTARMKSITIDFKMKCIYCNAKSSRMNPIRCHYPLDMTKSDNYSNILAILMNFTLLKRATAPVRKLFLPAKLAITKLLNDTLNFTHLSCSPTALMRQNFAL
jgi:hypothetical protein